MYHVYFSPRLKRLKHETTTMPTSSEPSYWICDSHAGHSDPGPYPRGYGEIYTPKIVRWGPRSPMGRGNFETGKGQPIVKYREYRPCAAAMRPVVKLNYFSFVFGGLPEPNRACLVGVYAVTLDPLLSLWNNLCDLVYQTPTKSYQRHIPVAFGISDDVTYQTRPVRFR